MCNGHGWLTAKVTTKYLWNYIWCKQRDSSDYRIDVDVDSMQCFWINHAIRNNCNATNSPLVEHVLKRALKWIPQMKLAAKSKKTYPNYQYHEYTTLDRFAFLRWLDLKNVVWRIALDLADNFICGIHFMLIISSQFFHFLKSLTTIHERNRGQSWVILTIGIVA